VNLSTSGLAFVHWAVTSISGPASKGIPAPQVSPAGMLSARRFSQNLTFTARSVRLRPCWPTQCSRRRQQDIQGCGSGWKS